MPPLHYQTPLEPPNFLRKFDRMISWGDQGRIKLKEGTHNLIHSVSEAVNYPVSMSKDVTVPPRTVASVVTLTDLPEHETKITYKMITADDLPDAGGNAITYPLCYATMVGGKQKCTQIVVNLVSPVVIKAQYQSQMSFT